MSDFEYRQMLSGTFPEISGAAFDELVDSMREHGFLPQFPILIHKGEIIDGWHRYKAATEAGVEPIFQTWTEGKTDAVAFVMAANATRRHLTKYQKQHLMLSLNPKTSNREIAKATGSSVRQVQRQRSIRKDAPELAEQIKTGEISAHSAEVKLGQKQPITSPAPKPATETNKSAFVGIGKVVLTISAGRHKELTKVAQSEGGTIQGVANDFIDQGIREFKKNKKEESAAGVPQT